MRSAGQHQAPRPRAGADRTALTAIHQASARTWALATTTAIRVGTRRALWAGVILWWPVTTTMREIGWLPNGWIRTVLVGISGTLGFSLALIHRRNSQQKQWRDSHGRATNPPAGSDRLAACEQQITELKTAIAAAYHAAGLEPPEPPQRLRLVSGDRRAL